MERPVRERDPGPPAAADRHPDRPAGDLPPSLPDVPLLSRRRAGASRGAVRARRRHLPAVRARLQHVGGGLDRLHRPVRHGRPDRRRDGDLSGGSRRPEARRAWRPFDAGGASGGGEGRGVAAAAAEGDDGLDDRGQLAADHVEPLDGRRSHEAAGHPRARRHGELARPRAHRDARHLLLVEGTRPAARGGRWATQPDNTQRGGGTSMMRPMATLTVVAALFVVTAAHVSAADRKPIHTQKTKDVVVTLASESGQWKQGKNEFVLEFTSAKDMQPVDAGKVTLNTSMTMSGMAPMIAGATLSPDKTPGRYAGTIRSEEHT